MGIVDRAGDLMRSHPNLDLSSANHPNVKENSTRGGDPSPVDPSARHSETSDHQPQYPDDSDDEIDRITARIIASRAASIPAQQVQANAKRIRRLLDKDCNVKEIYNHLVGEGRVDPAKVSYKQFADQVSKLRKQSA